jgi:hypothetical protein
VQRFRHHTLCPRTTWRQCSNHQTDDGRPHNRALRDYVDVATSSNADRPFCATALSCTLLFCRSRSRQTDNCRRRCNADFSSTASYTSEAAGQRGELTLFYPKWIPGNHAPTGNINSVVGLQISVDNNQTLSWRRDLFDEYAIHCEVPAGASSLGIDFDYLITKEASSEGATAMLWILSWHQVIPYPSGPDTDRWTVHASLKPAAGWKIGTALPIVSEGDTIKFKPVSLTSLVDSPVVMGLNYRHLVLAEGPPSNEMDIVADTTSALLLSEAALPYRRKLSMTLPFE